MGGGRRGVAKRRGKSGNHSDPVQEQDEAKEEQTLLEKTANYFGGERDDGESQKFSGHLLESVIEEVTLEGLDGITFQALKHRLGERDDVDVEDFEAVAPAVWNQLKCYKSIKFYLLPQPRPDLVSYKWYDYRDARGNFYEPLHAPEEIYPYSPVEDKERGIRGSCENYHTRTDITQVARKSNYIQLQQGLGNRLVIVANQLVREQLLLGSNFKKHQNISIVQYCMIERIGRARSCGEVTRGKISTNCFSIQPKSQFYIRKHLLSSGLIKRQNASIKFPGCRFPTPVTVFHLPRFYKRIESIASLNTRTIISWLNKSDSKTIPVQTVISRFGKHIYRDLIRQFPSLLDVVWEEQVTNIPSTVQTSSTDLTEGQAEEKVNTKSVRVIRLLITDVTIQNQIILKVSEGEEDIPSCISSGDVSVGTLGTDSTNIEEEQAINLTSASSYSGVQILRPTHRYLFSTDYLFLLRSLMRSGVGGLTLQDIGNLLHLTPLESRSCARNLIRHKICKEGLVKMHKQKAFTYSLAMFSPMDAEIQLGLSEKLMLAMEEKQMMQNLLVERKMKRIEQLRSRKMKRELRSSDHSDNEEDSEIAFVLQEASHEQRCNDKGSEVVDQVMRDLKSFSDDLNNQEISEEDSQKTDSPNETIDTTCNQITPSCSNIFTLKEVMEESALPAQSEPGANGKSEDIIAAIGLCNAIVATATATVTSNIVEQAIDIVVSSALAGNQYGYPTMVTRSKRPRDKEDSVDISIRKRMTRQRVAWMPEEDRIMLIAFIGSSMFLAKYTFERAFMYNAAQIRDILLAKSNGQSNKTCLAIRRRLHFLLRQKVHFNWYIQHVSEAVRDITLYETYIRDVMPPPKNKIYWLPPAEVMEAVVDYLFSKFYLGPTTELIISEADDPAKVLDSVATKNGLAGVDTLLFLRQLKRAEYYWKSLMFVIFCPMGETMESRRDFFIQWKGHGGSKEHSPLTSTKSLYLYYCWRFLKFFVKNCTILYNNMLMLSSLTDNGFQLVHFESAMNSAIYPPNLCLSLREPASPIEARLWTARSALLEQSFSGGTDISKDLLHTKKKRDNVVLESAARLLHRSRILVSAKGCDTLRLNKVHLKNFFGGMPFYSYDELWELLQYVNYESRRVDTLACLSVGMVMGILELTDFWTARITIPKTVFTLKSEWSSVEFPDVDVSDDDEQANDLVPPVPKLKTSTKKSPQPSCSTKVKPSKNGKGVKRPRDNSPPKKKKKQTNDGTRPLKRRRKKKKEDMEVTEMAEIFSALSVSGDHPSPSCASDKKEELAKKCIKETTATSIDAPKSKKATIATKKAEKNGVTKKSQKTTEVTLKPEKTTVAITKPEEAAAAKATETSVMKTKKESQASPSKVKVGLEAGENFQSSSADHNTLRLLRIRLHPSQSSGNEEEQAVNINFPNFELEFCKKNSSINRSLVGTSKPFSLDTLKELRRSLIELVYHHISEVKENSSKVTKILHLDKFLGKYSKLFDMINLTGAVGVSGLFLETVFERVFLVKGLYYLLDARLIFSIGVVHRKFVTFNYVKDWIVPIRPQPVGVQTTILGHVMKRPWVTAIGGISWSTVNRLFTALVGQLQKPALKLNDLCEVFAPCLSHVESLILVEALAKVKYVNLYKFQEPKVTLFSKHPLDKCDIEYNTDTLIDTKNVYVAVSPYITTLHSQLQHAIQQTTKKKPVAAATIAGHNQYQN